MYIFIGYYEKEAATRSWTVENCPTPGFIGPLFEYALLGEEGEGHS